jgi:hypothetical protein
MRTDITIDLISADRQHLEGRCGTMTNDYKRHCSTKLFAALNVLDYAVIGRCKLFSRRD